MSHNDPQDPARNLLFGILAFQLNFIDRRALLAAFDAWTGDRSRPLGAVLAEQGAISSDLLALLDGLVAAHLARHGEEPERSLAALTPIGSVREDLQAIADPEVQASIARVSADRGDLDAYATKVPSVGTSTSSGVRFQVLRPLNQGGMGVVSVALDTELDRPIALKEIREAAADEREYRARFLAEAEITGKLEHPGIIPIYGLGTYGDGRPFYAMRLIRGDKTGSLLDAIERFYKEPDPGGRVVEFRGLLGRFLDVCNAVAYAHSKGVLHRDLKPENVLLGPYGETLVVDWGLAKAAGRADPATAEGDDPVRLNLSGSESSPTLAGGAFGTPEYAPPEQMTGDLANVGTRSDVYGLGAVLYCLTTGQPPFSRKRIDLGRLITKIEAGDFPPPRQLRADVDRSLEAICLKAMGRKPADRYESARALAADVERYLADEPVAAYREPWADRARRWTKRHRTAVTATVAALVVASVGLVSITAVQIRANLSLDLQRRGAEDREAQAIDAVKRYRDAVANEPELKNTPALDGLRKRLLKEPLAFFRALRDRLQADRDTRPESLARLAGASFNLATLTNEIGDKQDALIAFRESLAIWWKLADANPAVTKFQSGLADSHNNIGLLLRATGKPAEALKAHESALAIRQKLADANPKVTEFQSGLAGSHNNIGVLLRATGKPAEALKANESALAIQQKLADANPKVTEFQSGLAGSHYNIGLLLDATGRPAEALKAHESALAIRQKLADANPKVTEFQSGLAGSHNSTGVLLDATGRPAEALKAHESALAIRQKLADANPAVTKFQSGLAYSHNNIGVLLRATGKPAEALKAHESALAIRQKLADANPKVTEFQSDLAGSHNNIGLLLSETGRPAEALKAHESAMAIRQKLVLEHPKSPGFASDLGGILNNAAMIDLDAQRFEEARVRLRQAVEWQRKALASNPANPTYRQYLANHLNNLIEAARGLGDSQGVAEAKRELATLRDSDPAMMALDARLSALVKGNQQPKDEADRLRLGQRAYGKGLHATAARLWAEALAADPKLGDDRQASHRYDAACAAALAGSGQGKDDPRPDEAARASLRAQALGWLRAELSAWKDVAMTDGPGNKELVAKTLDHWKQDTDLAGVRDKTPLSLLPETERKGWQALWADVEARRAESRADRP